MNAHYTLLDRFLDLLTAFFYHSCQTFAWAWNRTVGKWIEKFAQDEEI